MSAELRTRWGWHRLTDEWAQRLVGQADIQPRDLVLDIGAGTGALTAPLVAAGARVIAFELHPRRAHELRQRFARDNVVVVQADVRQLRLPRRPFSVVANPPFGAVTAILRRLVSPNSSLQAATLVVPRHVGERWSERRQYGAGRWAAAFDVRVLEGVPKSAFRPAPPGKTVVLRVERGKTLAP